MIAPPANTISRLGESTPPITGDAPTFGSVSPEPTSLGYAPDTVLVRYKQATTSVQMEAAQTGVEAEVAYAFTLVPGLVQLRLPADGPSVVEAVTKLSALPYVEYAQPDYLLSVAREPDDSYWPDLWGMGAIRAPEAWNTTTGKQAFVVAIIDTGIDYTHPDLAANIWTNANEIAGNNVDDDGNGYVDDIHGWDFVNGDNDPMDDHDHGTHTAGTVGAVGDNGIGVVGVNWNVQLMALKFIGQNGTGLDSDAARALEYATSMGVRVSNNSYIGWEYSQAFYDAIRYSQAAGHLFVAAAGNWGFDTDVLPMFPAAYDLDNIISVAAIDSADILADWSNYGIESVDLGAPGVWILSTVRGGYAWANGTSMAAPHVAGAAALLYGFYATETYSQIRDRILDTARLVPSLAGKTATGGVLDLAAALRGGTRTPTPTRGTPTVTPTATPPPVPIAVNTTRDRDGPCQQPPAGDCALREAIRLANDMPGRQTITIPAGTYVLTRPDILLLTEDVTLIGAGAASTIVDRFGFGNAFVLNDGWEAEFDGLTVINGNFGITSWYGDLVVKNCVVRDNASVGVHGGNVTIENSVIENNTVGGVSVHYNGYVLDSQVTNNGGIGFACGGFSSECVLRRSRVAGNGGEGVHMQTFLESAPLLIENSAIVDNHDWGITGSGEFPTAVVRNSTIARNALGGIRWQSPLVGTPLLALVNITLNENDLSGAATVENTIVGGAGCDTVLWSLGHNLIADPLLCPFLPATGDLTGDPRLGSYADGYYPLAANSRAIDAGNDASCTPADQLGQLRRDGNGDGNVVCDIGAIEFQPAEAAWRFRGYTYQGRPGDRNHGLVGVRLWLFGRDEGQPAPGRVIESKISDGSGFFNFYVTQPPGFDLYRLAAEAPPGMTGTGVLSEDGTVVDNLTVEWLRPLPEVHLNEFYFDIPTPTPTVTPISTRTPSPTLSPTASTTHTPTPSLTLTLTATETPTLASPPTDTPTPASALQSIWMPLILRFPPAPVWQIETVDGSDGAYVGGLVSLALDSEQRPAISYVDRDVAQLKFARYVQSGGNCGLSGDWQCDPIAPASSGPVWVSSSLAFDSADRPHIAYPSAGEGNKLMVAQWVVSGGNCGSDNAWLCQLIDESSWFGWVSMALDASDAAHISYADFRNGGLRYAHLTGAGGNCGPDQTWQCDVVVHTQTRTWIEHSLAVDVDGIPHIAYTNDGLRLAHYRGANGNCGSAQDWQCDLIDATSSGNVALRIDADNHPHIAYLKGQGVNYAHWVGAGGNCGPALSWQCDAVDASTWVGWGLALAFDHEGQPHLSYQAIVEHDLRYAHFVGMGGNCGSAGQWDCRTVDSDGDFGYVSSIAVDGAGQVHIGYLDGMNGDLKYAASLP